MGRLLSTIFVWERRDGGVIFRVSWGCDVRQMLEWVHEYHVILREKTALTYAFEQFWTVWILKQRNNETRLTRVKRERNG